MLYVLMAIATALTYGMFHNKQAMLGFPSVIFWALSAGAAMQLSADNVLFPIIALGCGLGMIPLCAFATQVFWRQTRAEQGAEDEYEEEEYFDEETQETKKRKVKRKKKESDVKEDSKKTDEMFDIGGRKREREDDDGIDTEPKAGRKGKKSIWGSFR